MRFLLDTHVLLWWLANDDELRGEARRQIAAASNVLYVSAATAWEIAIKRELGRLESPPDLESELKANGFDPLPITVPHAVVAGALPRHHADPVDRMLVAQAMAEGLTIITRDDRLRLYGVSILSG
jgi:PIN domain nuclease of toxin-antitoxin system